MRHKGKSLLMPVLDCNWKWHCHFIAFSYTATYLKVRTYCWRNFHTAKKMMWNHHFPFGKWERQSILASNQ